MMRWVVAGGGTAGSVVAAKLAEIPGNEVTLIEAGEATGPRSGGLSSLVDLEVPGATWDGNYLRGRGLGGSSRINGGVLSGEVPDPLPAETPGDDELGPVDRALLAAAPDAERVALARRDRRFVSAADVFLAPAGERRNLEVVSNAHVTRVDVDGSRAVGAVLGGGATVEADRVVLCAGAIGSPTILMRSGVDRPGLGEITDHTGRMFELTLRPGIEVDHDGLVSGAVLRRDGCEVLAMNHCGASRSAVAGLLVGWLASPRRGRVVLGTDGVPEVSFDPLDDGTATGLAAAESLAEELLADEPFDEFVTEWSAAAEIGGYFHASGTCRAVVDEDGAVTGCSNLFVADASVLDLPPSGLYGPVVANAQRLVSRWFEG